MQKLKYRLSEKAVDDLRTIWLYFRDKNPQASDNILKKIERKLEQVAHYPLSGPARPDIGPKARIFVVEDYVIVYEVMEESIFVATIVHGRRHPSDLITKQAD